MKLSRVLSTLMASIFLFLNLALAEEADIKNLQFSIRKLDSMQGLMVQLTPPAGHHFNMEAPTKLTLKLNPASKEEPLKAEIDKAPASIKASWNKKSTNCEVQAQVYLCDDQNKYCVPLKKTFACEKLSYDDVKSTNLDETAKSATQTAAKTEKKSPENSTETTFILNDSAKAFAQAKLEKKLVLIDFFGIWCPPCNVLDESVFNTPEFQKFSKDYVFLKMDADSSVSWELKTKYNIKGYPTVMLVNSEADEISRIVGSRKPKAFLKEMSGALKLKAISMTDRRKKADSQKDSEAAFQMAELAFGQEDYPQAMKYFLIALKNAGISKSFNESRKQKMLSTQVALLEESKDATTQKNLASLLESSLEIYPYGTEALERADKLATLADDLKNESLKNRALNAQFKNVEHLLKNPKLYEEAEVSEGDLYTSLAEVYDNLKDEAKTKESYGKAFDAYTRQIKDLKLDESKERGHNLERIYALYKSGRADEANTMYENMQKQYPEEFTFYLSHARVLNDQGKTELALSKAETALKFSYGDNQLRVVKMVADLRSKLGKKKEALQLLDETLKNFKAPEDLKVRTHNYLAKLKDLKEKIQNQ